MFNTCSCWGCPPTMTMSSATRNNHQPWLSTTMEPYTHTHTIIAPSLGALLVTGGFWTLARQPCLTSFGLHLSSIHSVASSTVHCPEGISRRWLVPADLPEKYQESSHKNYGKSAISQDIFLQLLWWKHRNRSWDQHGETPLVRNVCQLVVIGHNEQAPTTLVTSSQQA